MDEKQAYSDTAGDMYFSDEPIYKDWDYRCLAPDSHVYPEGWGTYNMTVFRDFAGDSADATPSDWIVNYDSSFNAWIDHHILTGFVFNPYEPWLATYGFKTLNNLRWHRHNNWKKGIVMDSRKKKENCVKTCDDLVRIWNYIICL